MDRHDYEVIIVGAGPIGLYTAFNCGVRELRTLVCDSLESPGGQLVTQYPEKAIYNLPGFAKVPAREFIARLEGQVDSVSAHVSLKMNFKVDLVRRSGTGFEVISGDTVITTGTVILAMGNGSFVPRKIGLENEENCDNIAYFVVKPENYADRAVLILGGGDSAVDWALTLEPLAKSVTLAHRRDEFRAKAANVEKLRRSSVSLLTPYAPAALHCLDGKVAAVELSQVEDSHIATRKATVQPCDDVIVSYGTESSANYLQDWGLAVNEGKALAGRQTQTDMPGLFACGDVCTYENRENQIVSGLSEGVMAASAASRYIKSMREEGVKLKL